jgi:hypothetical protein
VLAPSYRKMKNFLELKSFFSLPDEFNKKYNPRQSISRYGINGHYIPNFFLKVLYVKTKICLFKFFVGHVMIDTKKLYFLLPFFSAADFSNAIQLSEVANLLLKRASIPKTINPFSGGVMGNYFEEIFS